MSNSFFPRTVGDTGKAQPGFQVTGKAAVERVQNSKQEAALLASVTCVLLLGETCISVRAAWYQAESIYVQVS